MTRSYTVDTTLSNWYFISFDNKFNRKLRFSINTLSHLKPANNPSPHLKLIHHMKERDFHLNILS